MGWIAELRGKIVGLDTTPLIYFVEENPVYIENVRLFFEALDQGEFRATTSVVTLLEVLIHPLRSGNKLLAQTYRDIILNSNNLSVVDFSPKIAEKAAQLRADHKLRTPDAIQLASALYKGASFFLTNDARLPSLPNLKVLQLDELAEEDVV